MKVKFMPMDVEHEIKQGQSVMDLAHEKGLPIRSTCNGLPQCAECRIKVTDGEWNVNPPSRKELGLIGTGFYIDQRRLSCQMLCFGDITVDLQEQVEKGAEGPVTKKFLTKVHKATAAESHSLGGVLIEQEGGLLNEVKQDVQAQPMRDDTLREPREGGRGGGGGGGGQGGGGRDRDRGGGRNRGGGGGRDGGRNRGGGMGGPGPNDGQQMRGPSGGGGAGPGSPGGGLDASGGGANREGREGGGGRRRRRGGRGRNRGGGGGGPGGEGGGQSHGRGGGHGGGGNRGPGGSGGGGNSGGGGGGNRGGQGGGHRG